MPLDLNAFLFDIVLIFGVAAVLLFVGNRFRIPAIVGFIFAGVLVGPYGLALVSDPEIVRVLADIGIIFLLFSIGMQFSFRRLLEMRKDVVLGGGLQVALTIGAIFLLLSLLGVPPLLGLFTGMLVCHSSTTIIFRVFQERGDVNTYHARTTLGISLFQDLMSVPMLIALPLLAGGSMDLPANLLLLLLKSAAIFGFAFLIARFVVPKALSQITGTKNPELFLLSIILICFVITWGSSIAGLSLSLGAFLAGLTISESEYFYQAFASILPFKDIFSSLFFISIGMLLDLGLFLRNPLLIIALSLAVLLLKAAIAGFATYAIGHPMRIAVLSGLALSNIGEFAFVLSVAGIGIGLFGGEPSQLFLAVAIATMAAAPFVISLAPLAAERVSVLPLPYPLRRGIEPHVEAPAAEGREQYRAMRDHLVIVGFGVNGRNLARAARAGKIPYVVVDMNMNTVRSERMKGEPIFYGDATSLLVLEHAGIMSARILVIVINDPAAARSITTVAKRINPSLHIIVRTPFVGEIERLRSLGAEDVIVDEMETSLAIFLRVLNSYLIPQNEIERFMHQVKSERIRIFGRVPDSVSTCENTISLPDLDAAIRTSKIVALTIEKGSEADGKTLATLGIRRAYGITILAIKRGEDLILNPDSGTVLSSGDVAIVFGDSEHVAQVARLFRRRGEDATVTGDSSS